MTCHSEHPQPFGCPCGAETRLEFEVGAGGVGKLGGRGPAAMTDAELVPSCPFPSVVPVCKRPMIWWQFAAPAASSTPLQRVFSSRHRAEPRRIPLTEVSICEKRGDGEGSRGRKSSM